MSYLQNSIYYICITGYVAIAHMHVANTQAAHRQPSNLRWCLAVASSNVCTRKTESTLKIPIAATVEVLSIQLPFIYALHLHLQYS